MTIKTINITLDTSVFVNDNFLVGNYINELTRLHKAGAIKLNITDITEREILANFNKSLNTVIEKIKKPLKIVIDASYILKNIHGENDRFQIEIPDESKVCKKFRKEFNNWIEDNRIGIIDTDHIKIGEMMKDYFGETIPFKQKDKKSEFPDAFTSKATDLLFKSIKESTYFLTYDKGLIGYNSENIIIETDISSLLDTIIKESPEIIESNVINFIQQNFEIKTLKIIDEIKNSFSYHIDEELSQSIFDQIAICSNKLEKV